MYPLSADSDEVGGKEALLALAGRKHGFHDGTALSKKSGTILEKVGPRGFSRRFHQPGHFSGRFGRRSIGVMILRN